MNINHFPASDLQNTKACLEQKQTAKLLAFDHDIWQKSPREIFNGAIGKTHIWEKLAEGK